MPDTQTQNNSENEPVAVTLMLDPRVYQSFLQKAGKAKLEIGPYLSSTLSIVLGCRIFNETSTCVPQHPAQGTAQFPVIHLQQEDAKKLP